MNPKLIVIDGKTYNSVNEMPPEVRARYEQAVRSLGDEDRDGRTDIFDAAPPAPVMSGGMKFVVDGREYTSIEDLPPEARAKYEQAMGILDKNQDGMPDFLEGMLGKAFQTPAQPGAPATPAPRPALRIPQTASPTISPDTSNGWMLVITGGLLLLLCAAGAVGVWYFFLR
jgi:hypothetical protein